MLTIVDDIAYNFEIHFRESGLGLVSYCRDLVSVIERRETFISCGTTWVLILRRGRVLRPRHIVVGGGFHRVRFCRKSPESTKRFSQSELVFRYNNVLIIQYE